MTEGMAKNISKVFNSAKYSLSDDVSGASGTRRQGRHTAALLDRVQSQLLSSPIDSVLSMTRSCPVTCDGASRHTSPFRGSPARPSSPKLGTSALLKKGFGSRSRLDGSSSLTISNNSSSAVDVSQLSTADGPERPSTPRGAIFYSVPVSERQCPSAPLKRQKVSACPPSPQCPGAPRKVRRALHFVDNNDLSSARRKLEVLWAA